MADPNYIQAKVPYCCAFDNKIHRGYLRKTANLPMHKMRQMLHQPLLPIPPRMATGMPRHRDLATLINAFSTEIDRPDTAADPIKVGLDYRDGIVQID